MRTSLLQTLIRLAELGAKGRTIKVSTVDLASSLNLAQQSVSRHLIELEQLGFVRRQASVSGIELTITPNGIEELRQTYLKLKAVFEERPKEFTIRGTIFTGLGEGAYYVSQPSYKRQFEQVLGLGPYPGTLNIRLSPQEVSKRKELETYPGKVVRGFDRRNRSFGEVVCYPATIDGINCAIVLIRRTHYDESVLEVIAPVHIRSALNLKEGSSVEILAKTE
jgi:riboflavin kinase